MISWKWLLLIIPFMFWFGFFLAAAMTYSSRSDELIEELDRDDSACSIIST